MGGTASDAAAAAPPSLSGVAPPRGGAATANSSHIKHLCSQHAFGPAAFGPLCLCSAAATPPVADAHLQERVGRIIEESVDGVGAMRGGRGSTPVATMLQQCYAQGLFQLGVPSSPVNREIIAALRHIIAEMAKLPPRHASRVTILTELARACEDCQQVQAREILRIFGDLTAQNATLEGQLRYSLVRLKEAALNRHITQWHCGCDLDHTRVPPHKQRPHLLSAYIALIGDDFGFDGVAAARADRFLPEAKQELGRVDVHNLMSQLRSDISVLEWVQQLLSDINNQTPSADRLIDRSCLFRWVQSNLSSEAAQRIFYDDERAEEFAEQEPSEPTHENRYQPFLSCHVLVEILAKAQMLARSGP
eukprot:NODE_822_length_1351_cov_1099.003858.p1 GENE.NODE_822_length_1351_cov_1099.003858~~NODE_822_length_1351_cov_1099.003858.p1  ORF type:complete len:363 (-),score=93.57 NODE_822_length_1351_cov_1099.003858:245-1333(-)